MTPLTRITLDPEVMGGKPCIRGLRITVGTIVGLVASGRSTPDILAAYPYLEEADIREALAGAVVKGGFGLLELKPAHLSLEEIFLQLTTNDTAEESS